MASERAGGLVVAGEAAVEHESAEGALDDPSTGLDDKPPGGGLAADDLEVDAHTRRLLDDALTVNTTALNASTALGHRLRTGRGLGEPRQHPAGAAALRPALDAHQTALDTYRDLGDRHNEAAAWNNLDTMWRGIGAYEQAVEAGERAVAMFRELDDPYREGEALDELADTLRAAKRPAGEVRAMREASAAAYRRAGADTEADEVLGKADA